MIEPSFEGGQRHIAHSQNLQKPLILVAASTYPVDEQDSEPRFVYDLCQQLSKDYRLVVLTQSKRGFSGKQTDGNIDVLRYRYAPAALEQLSDNGGITSSLAANPFRYLLLPGLFVSQIYHLAKLTRQLNPALVHVHWIIPQGVCALLARKISKASPPILLTSHGGDLYGLKGKLASRIKRWCINKVDQFCVVSSAMAQFASQHFGADSNNTAVLPMGVASEKLFKASATNESSGLLFAGRLVKKKGVTHLLNAMPSVIQRHPEVKLTIVGDGAERIALESQVQSLSLQDHVVFTGNLSHTELATYYQKAAACVFPFIESDDGDMEGLGLVVLEAMACACPVVVGNVPAIHDMVTHGQTGLICHPEQTDTLAQQLVELLENADLRHSLALNALSETVEYYSWENCAQRYTDAYQRLMRLTGVG